MTWAVTAALVLVSLLAHEYAHVLVTRFFGAQVERVGFFPLGMMSRARGLERLHAWERYIIFAAGPLANFALALWAGATSYLSYVGVPWLDAFAFYNLVLGVFNLTPAMPLDGGRLLWQFLGNRLGILRASRIISRMAIVAGWAFAALGAIQMLLFPYNFTLLFAGIFILKKNKSIAPELEAAFHIALSGKNLPHRARTLPVKKIAISAETPIKTALERLAGDYFIIFIVNGKKLSEQVLIEHIFENGLSGAVGEVKQGAWIFH
ncbi:MAG: site-2 protease family protein [Defluviitaleaceae bacterium]|nr:site-2 protease family protein [Defluviitaleaceae bacterium]